MLPGVPALDRLRRRHHLRYKILLLACFFLLLAGSGILFLAERVHPFLASLCLGLGGLMAIGLVFLVQRKKRIASCLATRDLREAGISLEAWLAKDLEAWQRTTMTRMVVGLVLLGGYFLSLLAGAANRAAVMLPSFFMLLVILSIMRNWLIFLDQLFLQDVLHAGQDHSSGTPE